MNLKGWANELLKKLSDEVTIDIINKRVYLPDAIYSPRDNKMYIYGNAPSLVRTGILYLLVHELAHYEHMKRYGTTGDDYSETFTEIETEIKKQAWKIFLEETEDE